MTDKVDNSEAYGAIRWILDSGDMGFFFVVAPATQQKKIANLYESPNSAVYDYSKTGKPFSYAELSEWADSHAEKNVFFVLNMDAALQEENHIAALNMSRDLLTRKEKIWFFSMTKDLDNRLANFAHDFYSYVRQKVHFNAEEKDEFEGKYIMDFDDRHNVKQVKETLSRYKGLETQYMTMSFDGENTNSELLSAAIALSSMAILYEQCAEYANALRLLERVKEIRENISGDNHPDTAKTYNYIAFIYGKQGDYDKALEWFQKALLIDKKILGGEHPHTATTYNNIAFIYIKQEDYTKALEWHQKALSIREKIFGEEHPDTATSYNNIASTYAEQGDYEKALEWCKKALSVREEILGEEHPNTAMTYNNIAFIYSEQGEYIKALKWNKKALSVREKILGEEHPDTAMSYNNIAVIYGEQGDYAKALEWYQKAYDILLSKLGENHPDVIFVKNNIESVP